MLQKSIVNSLIKYQRILSASLFEDKHADGPELQPGEEKRKINFVNWFDCLDILKNSDATGGLTNGLSRNTTSIEGFYGFFCVYRESTNLVNSGQLWKFDADWYSGAAVMYEYDDLGGKIPIGLMSRGITTRAVDQNTENFHIVVGFDESVYNFLSNNGIEPPLNESEFSPRYLNWRQAELPTTPRLMNHGSHLTSGNQRTFLSTLLGCTALTPLYHGFQCS